MRGTSVSHISYYEQTRVSKSVPEKQNKTKHCPENPLLQTELLVMVLVLKGNERKRLFLICLF